MAKEFPIQGNAKMNDSNYLIVEVAGGVASGETDTGNPIKVGGKYNEVPPTLVSGEIGDVQIDSTGSVRVVTKPSTYAVDEVEMPNPPSVVPVAGEYRASATTYTDGDAAVLQTDASGFLKATLATEIAGEDITNDVLKVEQRFSYSLVTADTAVKSGAGFLRALTFSQNDAAPTAGTIDVYDNTAASGTKIFSWTLTTAVFNPVTVQLDCSFATGLYIDFTTTADVNVTVTYR